MRADPTWACGHYLSSGWVLVGRTRRSLPNISLLAQCPLFKKQCRVMLLASLCHPSDLLDGWGWMGKEGIGSMVNLQQGRDEERGGDMQL